MLRRTFLLISSFLLFTTLAVAGNRVEKKNSDITVNINSDVLSETDEEVEKNDQQTISTPTSTPQPNATEIYEEIEEVVTVTPMPAKSIDSYIYPGSMLVSKSDKAFEALSTDAASKVTDWYESKVKSEGFNVKSFVKTNTNDKIKNVISAAKSDMEIKVEITNSENGTSIKFNIY